MFDSDTVGAAEGVDEVLSGGMRSMAEVCFIVNIKKGWKAA